MYKKKKEKEKTNSFQGFFFSPLRNIMSESCRDCIKTRDKILHHHQNTTALSCTRDQNKINNTQLLWCNIHNQMCKLLTMHAMSAIYKCIRLQHLQTLFAYNGILYIQCIYIYKLSITYRNIPCNATSFKETNKKKQCSINVSLVN